MDHNAPQNAAQAADVTIVARMHAAFLPSRLAGLVMPELERAVKRFTLGGKTGVRHCVETLTHHGIDEDQTLVFAAGFVPRVKRLLERHGYTVNVDDRTRWDHLLKADMGCLQDPEVGREDPHLLNTLLAQPRGQIVVHSFDALVGAIVLVGQLFSDFNIYIVARNLPRVQQLLEQLSDQLDRPISSDPRKIWGPHRKMFVSTMQAFGEGWSDCYQIILFTDKQSMLAKRTQEIIATRWNATWYALRQSNQHLDPNEQFSAEEIFGEVIYEEPRPGPQPAAVDVVMVKAPPAPKGNYDNALERKRGQIWHHDGLNQLIVRVAKGIQRGHSRKLVEQGLVTKEQSRAIFADCQHPSVALLVENTEHAEQLHRLLPGWELRSGYKSASWLPTVSGREIATVVYADRFGVMADVLITGLGTPGWPLAERAFPRRNPRPDRVVVVDFYRDAGGRARRDLQRQITEYQERGWRVIN